MTSYIVRRILETIPVLLVVAVVVFSIVHLSPGDPARVILGDMATEEEVSRLQEAMGLDRPILVQFGDWFGDAVRGDLGESIFLSRPVLAAIVERIEPTLMLSLLSLVIAVVVGVATGVVAAVNHNKFSDGAFSLLALIGVSVPNFWLGLLLILVFAVQFGWLPPAGYQPLEEGIGQSLRYLLLPAITLGTSQAAIISRITRSSLLDILNQDFVRTATAKGLPKYMVILKHALRNSLVPVITVIGLVLAALLGGAVVVETVFAVPGLGRLVITSIARRDYPVIQGAVLIVTTVYVLVNLGVDLLYGVVDPRIRY